jgi:hypothetical protein
MSNTGSAYSTFSPDGAQVAFGYGGNGWPAFAVPAAGGDVKPLGNAEGRIRGWTRDGRYLLVWRAVSGNATIGVLDLSTGRPIETMRSARRLGSPKLSPDNRWVAFQVDVTQRGQIWVAPFRGCLTVLGITTWDHAVGFCRIEPVAEGCLQRGEGRMNA